MRRPRLKDVKSDTNTVKIQTRSRKRKEANDVVPAGSGEGSPNKIGKISTPGHNGEPCDKEEDVGVPVVRLGEDDDKEADEDIAVEVPLCCTGPGTPVKPLRPEGERITGSGLAGEMGDGLRRRPIHSRPPVDGEPAQRATEFRYQTESRLSHNRSDALLHSRPGIKEEPKVQLDQLKEPTKWSTEFRYRRESWPSHNRSDTLLYSRLSIKEKPKVQLDFQKGNYLNRTNQRVLNYARISEAADIRTSRAAEKKQQGNLLKYFASMFLLILVILLASFSLKTSPGNRETDFSAFLMDVKSAFPSQRVELWRRSTIHLQRHLQLATPTEPVSMILTAGRRAEKTLRCLAGRMAAAFSSYFNASVLHIDGASRAALDSDQAKLVIDQELRGAFEGDKMAAVIHRFDELPPGSTLIFYRYCDHENAAFKTVLLIFTILLPTEKLEPELSLNAVEEMVHDHIQHRFISSDQPGTFDQMDHDKFGGLWSRISHLILPVSVEDKIESNGCTA